jgi:hypothetical protein
MNSVLKSVFLPVKHLILFLDAFEAFAFTIVPAVWAPLHKQHWTPSPYARAIAGDVAIEFPA